MTQLYRVEPIPNKGQAMIAIQAIPKGTRIITETALFKVPDVNIVNTYRC